MKIKEKHIERLTKGRKSGANIGSRAVWHRLREYEQNAFSRAIKYGYLVTSDTERPNLKNVWHQYCFIKQLTPWVLIKQNQDNVYFLFKMQEKVMQGTKKECIFLLTTKNEKHSRYFPASTFFR